MTGSLCHTFQELAAQTSQRLQEADRTGLFWSEETNTETLLLELRRRHPYEVAVQAFTKAKEARNGADWEWWLGSSEGWFGMRVQAKRIKLSTESFLRLHKQKAKGQPDTQINTLIQAASRDCLTPAYCFYVFSKRWPSAALWASPLGCLIAHASAVRLVGSEALSKLMPVAAPWHLLVCSCLNAAGAVAPSEHMRALLHKSAAASGRRGMFASVQDAEFPLFPPQSNLPDYMQRLFATLMDGATDQHPDEALSAVARQRGLAGFVLIRATSPVSALA